MPPPPPIGVVLSAGASTRMGQPKALLPLNGGTLLQAHIAALRHRCRRLIVVTGAHADQIAQATPDPDVQWIINPHWERTGMAESLSLALQRLTPSDHVLVTPVDVPPAPSWVLDALLQASPPALPLCAGLPGHPVLIPALARERLRTGTLRDVLERATRVPVAWTDGSLNLNRPEQWAAWATGRG